MVEVLVMPMSERIFGCIIFTIISIISFSTLIGCLREHYYGWGMFIAIFVLIISAANVYLYARGSP